MQGEAIVKGPFQKDNVPADIYPPGARHTCGIPLHLDATRGVEVVLLFPFGSWQMAPFFPFFPSLSQ